MESSHDVEQQQQPQEEAKKGEGEKEGEMDCGMCSTASPIDDSDHQDGACHWCVSLQH